MTQAEQDFIEQFARTHLVEWCCQTILSAAITHPEACGDTTAQKLVSAKCLQHAIDKGWVSKSTPHRVLAKGFSTAAAFLKR